MPIGEGGDLLEIEFRLGSNASGTLPLTLEVVDDALYTSGDQPIAVESLDGEIRVEVTLPPVADFTASVTSGVVPLEVSFTDASSGEITSYEWDFGDGGTSTEASPTHTYTAAGSYIVTLTATGPGGSATGTRTITVTAGVLPVISISSASGEPGGTVKVRVSVSDLTGVGAGDLVIGYDASVLSVEGTQVVGAGTEFDFVQAGTQTAGQITVGLVASEPLSGSGDLLEIEFRLDSNASGRLPVTVEVEDHALFTKEDQPIAVTVQDGEIRVEPPPPPPEAGFTESVTSGDASLEVRFTDASSGEITSRAWDFGDGGTSAEPNPSHTYTAAGTYTVTLTVTGPGGSATRTQTITVTARETPVLSISSASGEPGGTVKVRVSVSDLTGIGAGDLVIRYDASVLSVEGTQVVDVGNRFDFLGANTQTAGEIKIGLAIGVPISEGGDLLEIEFRLGSNASGNLPLTLEVEDNALYTSGDQPIPVEVLPATVQVEGVESPVSIDFDLAAGSQGQRSAYNAVPGKVYELQLNVEDAPEINGWSVVIEYDSEQVNYVSDSFQVSEFLPGLVSLPLEGEGSIGVGGAILGSDAKNSGEGTLGTLSFEILEGFAESTDLVLTEVSFRRTDGMDDIRAVRFVATISSEVVEPPCPEDFDGNNLVNFQDFFRFADHFGITEASPDWDPLYDLAPNGAINFQDFFVFADAFGTQCAE